MRAIWLAGFFCLALAADDSGVPPRPKPSDYPVHENAKADTLAAVIVPADQIRKMFSAEVAKGYLVVEVAVYPADGHSFDVDLLDFALKVGGQVIHAEKPRDVAIPWPEKGATIGNRGPAVSTETGVIVARGTDPVTGRPRTGVGTWEDVGVSNTPRRDDPPPAPKPDQSALEDKIRAKALPEGRTTKPVAGYLYFPQYGRSHKKDPVALNYSKDEVSIDLKFPK